MCIQGDESDRSEKKHELLFIFISVYLEEAAVVGPGEVGNGVAETSLQTQLFLRNTIVKWI